MVKKRSAITIFFNLPMAHVVKHALESVRDAKSVSSLPPPIQPLHLMLGALLVCLGVWPGVFVNGIAQAYSA